jgi:uncharacterized protein (TIGR03435 family)
MSNAKIPPAVKYCWTIADQDIPSLFTAFQEQLGLKLESKKAPVEMFVIDHVERPNEN